MIPTNNEHFTLSVHKRKENSAYEYEKEVAFTFKGRPASQLEIKGYRIQKGVNGGTDSIFIYSSNLPHELKVDDKIDFNGKQWQVKSIGYYYDDARFINPSALSDEQILNRCPKGINIE